MLGQTKRNSAGNRRYECLIEGGEGPRTLGKNKRAAVSVWVLLGVCGS